MNLLHRLGATLGGVLAGGSVVAGIEWISSLVYPMPENLEMSNREKLAQWVGTLPVGAFLIVLAAWACGCFVGCWVARRLAPERSAIPALFVWTLLTVGAIANMVMIPHPVWFWFAGIAVCLIFGLLGLVMAAPASYVVSSRRIINAPLEKVFKTLATVDEFKKAVPGIVNVEFLTDKHYGVGTQFRETRMMNGREATTNLEVTELVENQNVRMVSDAGGTIWDTIFTVEQDGSSVLMNMKMDCRPYKFASKAFTPMIIKMVDKFVQQDMDSVKQYSEQADPQ